MQRRPGSTRLGCVRVCSIDDYAVSGLGMKFGDVVDDCDENPDRDE